MWPNMVLSNMDLSNMDVADMSGENTRLRWPILVLVLVGSF
jgi:hypothetical protein